MILISLLQSCKKETNFQIPETGVPITYSGVAFSRDHNESNITAADILSWLNERKGPQEISPNRNEFIAIIIESLNFELLLTEEWSDEEFMISIPLMNAVSMHEAGSSQTSLVIFEDKFGHIYRGELAIVNNFNIPTDSSQVSLKDLYLNNNTYIGYNGKIQLINFQDFVFSETIFEDGNVSEHNSQYGRYINEDDCVHWFHIHMTYNLVTGEIIDYEITDLGCLTCPPNALCDVLEGATGGGSAPSTMEHVQKTHEVPLLGNRQPNNTYNLLSSYTLFGDKNTLNPSQNIFTGIQYVPNSVHVKLQLPFHENNLFTYQVVDQNESFVPSSATATIQVLLTNSTTGLQTAQNGHHIFFPRNSL